MTVEEKAFHDKIDQVELEELMYDEFYELIAEAKKIGYAKAMRWRDPEDELPSDHALVFVKFKSFIEGEYNYDSDFIMTDDTGYKYFSIYGETVIGWRPIE